MFRTLGMQVPSPKELMKYVGPPLLDAFRDFAGMDEAEALNAATIYRTIAIDNASDVMNNSVFPGIPGALADLRTAGLPLGVATSKPEWRARNILDHFELTSYFAHIAGASRDETLSAKADVVAEVLRRLRADGADLSRTVMVGDRSFDVEGATANNLPSILVGWGYGSLAEAAGTIARVDTPSELTALLLGL
jgi:phosphoglycolate phosphatase